MVNARAKLSGRERFHDISFLIFRICVILSGPTARGRRHDSREDPGFLAREPQIPRDEKGGTATKEKNAQGVGASL
jgi:hypothetical protein